AADDRADARAHRYEGDLGVREGEDASRVEIGPPAARQLRALADGRTGARRASRSGARAQAARDEPCPGPPLRRTRVPGAAARPSRPGPSPDRLIALAV